LSRLLANGQVIDWILLGMVLEGIGLTSLFIWRGKGVAPFSLLPNLASGMCLLLAMRLALSGAWWGFAGAALFAALLFHLADLARLWR